MKKYVLFAFKNYYPSGGMGDFHGSFNSIDEAKKRFESQIWKPGKRGLDVFDWDQYQILDRDTWEIVDSGNQNAFI